MGESNRDQMDGEIGSVVGAGAVIWSDLTTDAGDKGGPRIQLARRNLRVVWSVWGGDGETRLTKVDGAENYD